MLGAAFSLVLSEIRAGTLPKTFLFEGKDETSRHNAAIHCAAALMCEGRDGDIPCTACSACLKALDCRHPDMTVLSCRTAKVDDIRAIRQDAFVSPFEAECKIFVLDGAHLLNVQSQNALLKILEEPPERVFFILTAPSSKMLLETVRSRCTVFSLGNLDTEDIYRSVCVFSDGKSEEHLRCMTKAISYIDGFEVSKANIDMLGSALAVCNGYFGTGEFPFSLLSTKKEESEALKLTFKVLSLCALEVCEAKKGTRHRQSILDAASLENAVMRMPLRTAFSHYEFFLSLLERIEGNANMGAVISALRAHIAR